MEGRWLKILKTDRYDAWFKKLKSTTAKARINARVRRIQLAGGDKSTQQADIKKAKSLLKEWEAQDGNQG